MNTPSGSSVNNWLSRAALALALTAGADIGTSKEADAAPGDQVTKITNPDAYLCTAKPSVDMLRVKVLSIVHDLTQPKGKDVAITSGTELDQKVSGLSQDVMGQPITTYRQKYHVIYWPGDAKFEGGYYFIDKDTKTIALGITATNMGTYNITPHIIEGATPADDTVVLGLTVCGTLSDGKGGLQIPKKVKTLPPDITDNQKFYKSTMIGIKEDPATGKTFLKRFAITTNDITEQESILLDGIEIAKNFDSFTTYKDAQGKETTYVMIWNGMGFPTGIRLYNIKDFKDFKDVSELEIVCPDGRFEFKWDTNGNTTVTDTWNADPKTNTYTMAAGTATSINTLMPLKGYDIPTFELIEFEGKHWLIQITSTSPLTVTVTENYSDTIDTKGSGWSLSTCIPNPQPPPPDIKTKPAGAETVEGAETSGADTSGAEAGVVEAVVVEKEPDAGSKEVISSSDGNNSDGDAIGSPEVAEPNPEDTQKIETVQKDADPTEVNTNDAAEQDVTAQKETDNGTPPIADTQAADAGSGADAISATDTATIQPKPSSPSPSANSGCSATPGTTRTSTRSALAQLGFLMTIAAGAQMMRRRKEAAR